MEFKTLAQAKLETGLSYLGKINNGAKHIKAGKYGELVYTIYLAPGNMSGYEVCPGRTPECTALCLNESGHNRMESDTRGNFINDSRIKKTKLFFDEREFFTRWVIFEINSGIAKAQREGKKFSVRINNTSDISPEQLYIVENGIKKNILELFPNTIFYDYTKVANRVLLTEKYINYDITYSFNGHNWDMCEKMLHNGTRVAVVFEKVPDEYKGYKVIDGDKFDMRYKDPNNVIVGLKYKKTRTKVGTSSFVIRQEQLIPEFV